jgi:hypothetical protein
MNASAARRNETPSRNEFETKREMSDALRLHAFSHAPAALRILRFAADTAPRVLELAHVSAFLRECAVEFGCADATLPGALRCEYACWRYFELRDVVERNAACCSWLAAKLLACRSGAPVPAAALAPDVTRHDVNWGAGGARRHEGFAVSGGGSALMLIGAPPSLAWAQGAVGVTSGKHYFQVCITQSTGNRARVGWVDRALRTDDDENGPGFSASPCSCRSDISSSENRRRSVSARPLRTPAPWAACSTPTRAR